MTFWLASLLICIGATALLLLPILRPKNPVATSENLDLDFYRDQLKSLEDQQHTGGVEKETLEAEKDEIARRMLRASRQARPGASAKREFGGSSKLAAVGILFFVPVFSVLLYINLGSPHIADVPLSAQKNLNADDQNIGQLVARAEDHLKSNPDDVRGWEVLARVYGSLGRHDDRAHALGQLIRLQGENATRLTDLAEALTVMGENVVSERAKALFERALSITPNHRKARFYLALALQQESKFEDSLALWRGLAKEAPGDWETGLRVVVTAPGEYRKRRTGE